MVNITISQNSQKVKKHIKTAKTAIGSIALLHMAALSPNLEALHTLAEFLLRFIYLLGFGRRRWVISPVMHHIEHFILDCVLFFQAIQDGIPYVLMDAFIGKCIIQVGG